MRNLMKLHKNSKGFTLVELMIVVAIIGILAAIAIPQFAAYRTRSFNANAKAMNKQGVNSQSDLNAELGCYGHSTAAPIALNVAADPGAGVASSGAAAATAPLAIAATNATPGGAVIGTNAVTTKIFAVPLGIGNNMTLSTFGTAAAAPCLTGGCSHVVMARADRGDTAYGSDSDTAGTLFSVSNPAWPAAAPGLQATPVVSTDNVNDYVAAGGAGAPGNGAPTATWQQVQ